MQIMLVDDEEIIRLGLSKIISQMELDAVIIGSYGNGLDALNHLTRLNPGEVDLLITDIKMPMMDGLKLIEHARAKFEELPIIVLSGFNEFEYARKALRYGVMDYLLKPIDKTELYKLLKRLGPPISLEAAALPDGGEIDLEEAEASSEHYVVERIKGILDKEYDRVFELERLADQINLSPSYISRLFKSSTGLTITDYLIQLRIEKAKQFLSDHPDLKNYQISQLVGYSDAVYFNKLFKRMTGMTPKDYKRRHHTVSDF